MKKTDKEPCLYEAFIIARLIRQETESNKKLKIYKSSVEGGKCHRRKRKHWKEIKKVKMRRWVAIF